MQIGVRAHLNGIAWSSEFRTVVQRLVRTILFVNLVFVNIFGKTKTFWSTSCDGPFVQRSCQRCLMSSIQSNVNWSGRIFDTTVSVSDWRQSFLAKKLPLWDSHLINLRWSELGKSMTSYLSFHPHPTLVKNCNAEERATSRVISFIEVILP